MWRTRRHLMLTGVFLLAVAPLPGLHPATADGPTARQPAGEKVRPDPREEAHVRQNLRAFEALPPARQEALRRLDRDLHEQDPATADRLTRVMERYALWLKRLPEKDRKRIESAPGDPDRLRIIKEIRERQWVERLPRVYREELGRLQGEARARRIRELHQEQASRRQQWKQAFKRAYGDTPTGKP